MDGTVEMTDVSVALTLLNEILSADAVSYPPLRIGVDQTNWRKVILDRVRTLAIPRAIPPSPRPSPAPPGPGRARPVGPGPVGVSIGVILDCSEAASIVSPPGRLRRWPDGRLQGARRSASSSIRYRLTQPSSSAPASVALFMVYERYSGGWRRASLAPVPTSMWDSMVRGSSENKYMLAIRCRTYVSYRIGR
jgi:hypothetical protein